MTFLPTFYEDPFMAFRPFPAENTSNLYVNHWHEIAFLTGFYFVAQAISPYVSTKLFGHHYTLLNRKTKINFDIHMVSMVQCVISLVTLTPTLQNRFFMNRLDDPEASVMAYFPYGGFVASCAIGYFVWDSFVCLRYFDLFGFGFLFHGLAALWVFGSVLRPYCIPWVGSFLIFELSTPFVNVNWFACKLPAGVISEKVILINGLLLLFSFFSVRILWGFYAVGMVARDMILTWGNVHWIFPLMLLLLNGSLDILNVFWFYKMLRIARKKIKGKKTKEVAKEAVNKLE